MPRNNTGGTPGGTIEPPYDRKAVVTLLNCVLIPKVAVYLYAPPGGTTEYARCNFDGKPIHPDGAQIMAMFRKWLQLSKSEQKRIIRFRDPEWISFLLGDPSAPPA